MTASSSAMGEAISYPIRATVDPELDALTRLAAWIGSASEDDTFCSFTSLLIALLFGDHEIASWLRDFAKQSEVDIGAILKRRGIGGDLEASRERARSGGLPQGRPLFSTSAQRMLEGAMDVAKEVSGRPEIGVRHLAAAYAFRVPGDHVRQMQEWGFDLTRFQGDLVRFLSEVKPAEAEAWSRMLPGAPGAEKRPRDPGTGLAAYLMSLSTLRVLRRAVLIAQDPNRHPAGEEVSTETVLDAMADTVSVLEGEERADIEFLTNAEKASLRVFPQSSVQPSPAPFTPDEKLPDISVNLKAVLDLARGAAERTTRSTEICTRHLVAALLIHESTPPTSVHQRLRAAGQDVMDLRRRFLADIRTRWPNDDPGAWDALLSPPVAPGARGTGPREFVSTYDTDNPLVSKTDLLDVEDEARAFARLIASCKTQPPLSIGVFGEWGSGKTFFMERIRHNVDDLATRYGSEQPDAVFHKGVVQIQFNAWHYIETNLWASLVEFIFDELDRWLRPQHKADQIEALFEQLATSRQLKLQAIQQLVQSKREREEAKKRLGEAREAYETALVRRSAVTPRDFWTAVRDTFYDKLKNTPEGRAAKEKIKQAGDRLGLPGLQGSAADLQRVLTEAAEQAGRARLIGRSLLASFGKTSWWASLMLLLLLLPATLVGLTHYLDTLLASEWLKQIGAATIGISSILTVLAGFVGAVTKQATGALHTLESFRSQLEGVIEEKTKEPQANLAQAEREVAIREAALHQAERELSAADQRVAEANQEYESGTARGRLNRFIRDKVVKGDYAKHLGIIATIRKDFGQLAQIMDDGADPAEAEQSRRLREDYEHKVNEIVAANWAFLAPEEITNLTSSQPQPPSENLRMFRRIILYIDDLDRCPPKKVVEVLQAIHLLLFFKLFVVVVAVDARWVSRALRDQYPDLLDESVSSGHESSSSRRKRVPWRAASSQDYLEKIFQIPYWVRPMDGPASERFVGSIASPDISEGERKPPPDVKEEHHPENGKQDERITRQSSGDASNGEQPSGTSAGEHGDQGSTHDGSQKPHDENPKDGKPIEPRMEKLFFHPWEAEYMAKLAPFTGQSPRRAKRFVNVYRLIKAGLADHEDGVVLGDTLTALGYQAMLAQLAIVTGAPKTAWLYFAALPQSDKHGETLDTFIERLSQDPRLTAEDDWNVIRGVLSLLGSRSKEMNGSRALADTGPALVNVLRATAPIAQRYSFIFSPRSKVSEGGAPANAPRGGEPSPGAP
jgi:KAP-like P-loop domain-containing protein